VFLTLNFCVPLAPDARGFHGAPERERMEERCCRRKKGAVHFARERVAGGMIPFMRRYSTICP